MKQITIVYCDRIIMVAIMLMIFWIPLFFGLNINSLDLQKIALMWTLSLIIAITWVVKIVFTREFKFVRTPLDIPILAYLLISIIATIFSIHPIISLFGFYNHFEGLLMLITYIFIYYTLVNFINKEIFPWMTNVIILSGVITAGYAILQYYGLDPVKWEMFSGGRVSSSLGNPIGFGNYVIMVLGITLSIFFSKKIITGQKVKSTVSPSKKKKRHNPQITTKSPQPPKIRIDIPYWIYGICIGIILFGFCFSASRAPFLGMLGGIGVIGLLSGKRIILHRKKQLGMFGIIFVCYLLFSNLTPGLTVIGRLATLFNPPAPAKQAPFEVGTFTATSTANLNPRIYLWQGALNIVRAYPILGIGLDTIGILHLKYKPIESAMAEGAYATAASAHNELLDIWVSRGTIGLIIYLWLLIAFVIICLKTYWYADDTEKFYITGLLAAFVAYLIQNQFSPTGISASYFFWTILGLGMVFKTKLYSFVLPAEVKKFGWLISLGTIGGAVWLWVLLVVKPCIADFNYEQGTLLQTMPQYEKDMQYRFERALQFNPYEIAYHREVCSMYLVKAQSTGEEKWIKKTIEQTKKLVDFNPYDGVGNSILGAGYYLEGKELDNAVKYFKKSIEFDPYNPDPHNVLGLTYQRLGKDEAAIKEFKRTLWLKPDYSIGFENLKRTYARTGKGGDIVADIKELLTKDSGLRTTWLRERLVESYLQQNNLDEALKECLNIMQLSPENVNICRTLGAIYVQQGKKEEAKKAFKYLLELDPNDAHAKEFLARAG